MHNEATYTVNAIGIDVSKSKSMVAALRPLDEVVITPCEFLHSKPQLERLVFLIRSLDGETRVVMALVCRRFLVQRQC